MYDRSPSRSRWRWWLIAGVVLVAAVLLLNSSFPAPVRGVVNRLTMPAQRVLRQAGQVVRNVTGSVGDLATLRERNDELDQLLAQLTVENVRLKEIEAENTRLRRLLNFPNANPGYGFKGSQVLGRVVADDPSSAIQSIVIDLGEKHGVLPGMPVVTERGLVGRITEVYDSGSRVLLITDSKSNVNTNLQSARLRGILRGRTGRLPIMDYLAQDEPIGVGDIVVTSGEGSDFPAGIPVGQVIEVERNDVEMFQRAVVKTTVDFNTLETVLVVTNFVPVQNLENLPER
ncbi:MAG: rod shape-determining protein MreC [Chloroflexota bacterium]|nr:rod shape-determining protein MreC [Chloroflexota bacterium]